LLGVSPLREHLMLRHTCIGAMINIVSIITALGERSFGMQ